MRRGSRAAKKGALVLGGGHVGLALARSLGRHGVPVWCLIDDYSLAAYSRYCSRRLPFPRSDHVARRDFLLELCSREKLGGWTLYPTSDESARDLARHHEELADRFVLTVPPWASFQIAYDKRDTHRIAEQLGVDFAPTYFPSSRDELRSSPCAFPVILKPAPPSSSGVADDLGAGEVARRTRRGAGAIALEGPPSKPSPARRSRRRSRPTSRRESDSL